MDDDLIFQKPVQQKNPTELLTAQTRSLSELVEIQKNQKVQISELQKQNKRMIELLEDQQRSSATSVALVKIEDVNMPFSALVGFLLKVSFAAIPAGFILGIIYALVIAIFGDFGAF